MDTRRKPTLRYKKAREILPQQVIDVLEVVSTSRRFVILDQDQQ